MEPGDAVRKLAEDIAVREEGTEGMILKAALVYDYIDGDSCRQLAFAVTDDMTPWDLDALLGGVQRMIGRGYSPRGRGE